MVAVALNDAGSRRRFFQRRVLANLQYWQTWLPDKLNDTAALDRERNGLMRAISYALELDEAWDMAFELIDKLAPYMERRGYWDSWQWVLEQGLKIAQRREDAHQLATLHHLLARLALRQSRSQEGVSHYRRAIRFSRQVGDYFSEGRACTNLGFYCIEQGNLYRAEVLCLHALRLFKDISSNHGLAHTENHLGLLYTRLGRWAEAKRHLELACSIWNSMNDDKGLVDGYMNLGVLYLEMERPECSLFWSEKALHQAKRTGDELAIGRILNNFGIAYLQSGNLEEAESNILKAETIANRYSYLLGLAQTWDSLGTVYHEQKKLDKAIHYLEKSRELHCDLGNKSGELKILAELALVKEKHF
jgi:tetratricopeptide (TPR) repeat protein